MKKLIWCGATVAAVLLMAGQAQAAATATAGLPLTVNVNARAKLTLGVASITFGDQDPDVVAVFTSAPVSVDVKARTTGSSLVTLTLVANQDLTSGTDVIPISNLTWTAAGTGFTSGTANKTTSQNVGSWAGSGSPSGSQTFSLPNSWTYAQGSYTAQLNYTLTVP